MNIISTYLFIIMVVGIIVLVTNTADIQLIMLNNEQAIVRLLVPKL